MRWLLVFFGLLLQSCASTSKHSRAASYFDKVGTIAKSSEDNGTALAAYLRTQIQNDPRKFIVIGYSKGAPDTQTALAKDPTLKDAVAAFVAVAGAGRSVKCENIDQPLVWQPRSFSQRAVFMLEL